jgi:hypothetical protein
MEFRILASSACFPDGTTYTVLLKDMVSINYQNLILIVIAILEKIAILFLGLI